MTAYQTWRKWEKDAPEGIIRRFLFNQYSHDGWVVSIEEHSERDDSVDFELIVSGATRESASAALLERAKKPLIPEVTEDAAAGATAEGTGGEEQ